MGKFDGLFDDVVVNAKAAANAVSKKASNVYGSSKQKLLAAELRGDINKKLRELGALTYKSQTTGTDVSKETAEIISEINELKESLDVINKNIAANKNSKKCPQCDANLPKNSVFCNICGAKLETEEVSQPQPAQEEPEPVEEADETPITDETEETDEFTIGEE